MDNTQIMETQEIGKVVLVYSEDGEFDHAYFIPTMEFKADQELMSRFKEVECKSDEDKIISDASSVFAAWFQKMNEIELADRAQYHIEPELISCEKHSNGKVSKVQIKFVFKHL
jgi:hypothetical protein